MAAAPVSVGVAASAVEHDEASMVAAIMADLRLKGNDVVETKTAVVPTPQTQRGTRKSWKQYLDAVVQFDNTHRRVGVTADLVQLDHIKFTPTKTEWDGSIPLLMHPVYDRSNGDGTSTKCGGLQRDYKSMVQTSAEFASLIPKWLHQLLSNDQLVLAGGAVERIIQTKDQYAVKDWDLFIVGPATGDFQLMSTLRAIRYAYPDVELKVHKTRWVTTICWVTRMPHKPMDHTWMVQLIRRKYTTISELLHSFDLGPCSFAFDGLVVRTTGLGKLALVDNIMVLDLSHRRVRYEGRLVKYWYRGYNLVLPQLNIEPIRVQLVTDDLSFELLLPYIDLTMNVLKTRHNLANGQLVLEMCSVDESQNETKQHQNNEHAIQPDSAGQAIAYGDDMSMDFQNLKCIMQEPMFMVGLSATLSITADESLPDLETLKKLQPVLRAQDIRNVLYSVIDADGSVDIPALSAVVGSTMIHQVIISIITGSDSKRAELITTMSQALFKVVSQRVDSAVPLIPWEYRTVTDATDLVGDQTMTDAAWYGHKYFKALTPAEAACVL